jgi:hypothetical protein
VPEEISKILSEAKLARNRIDEIFKVLDSQRQAGSPQYDLEDYASQAENALEDLIHAITEGE